MFEPEPTGRTRHQVLTYRCGFMFLRKTTVLVLQHEVTGFVPEYSGGTVDGSTKKWWKNTEPSAMMINDPL